MASDTNQVDPGTSKHADHFLTEWREYRGFSVRGLATVLNVSHSKISRIETGESELKPSFAKKVARFFNIPLVALFTVNPQGEGRKTAEMLDVWAQIDPGKQEDVLRVMRAYLPPNGRHQSELTPQEISQREQWRTG